MPRRKKVSDSVVVITGASSGIGKATAYELAHHGAALVLASRREEALDEVRKRCEERGAHALAVPTDVTNEDQVKELAKRAAETFGRIDVWMNNAAVTLFGKVEETPTRPYFRVIETNLFGYILGARAVLPYFREQGHGTLINMDSVVGSTPQPYTSAYVISKAGIRALSASIRMELSLDGAKNIHVSTIMPATIDTPFFQHAANYTGREVKAMEPVYPPEKVARAVVQMIESPKREVYVGAAGRLMAAEHAVAPGFWEWMGARQVDANHLKETPAEQSEGNLWEPSSRYTGVHGGWQHDGGFPIGKLALAGTALAVAAVTLRRR